MMSVGYKCGRCAALVLSGRVLGALEAAWILASRASVFSDPRFYTCVLHLSSFRNKTGLRHFCANPGSMSE
jgi:hypothetical protein